MQGFNMGRYVPPDAEGVLTGNQLNQKRAANSRGTTTVRFEMPYSVWCLSCPKETVIGQGVRFNAEKRRTGSYYTTPIWTFTLHHADCSGVIVVRTDPQNTAYEIVSGARRLVRADDGDDPPRRRDPLEALEHEQLRQDAFGNLEKTIQDRERLVLASKRIDELAELSARQWEDPGLRNQNLRNAFRRVRKQHESQEREAQEIKDRIGIDFDILPESDADRIRAGLVEFGNQDAPSHGQAALLSKPLFPSRHTGRPTRVVKKQSASARARENLVSGLISTARASKDPFFHSAAAFKDLSSSAAAPRPKRKQHVSVVGGGDRRSEVPPLVDYDSE